MGRKEQHDRKKGGFQKKNANISKRNQHRGGHRVQDKFKGKKNFNNNYQKPAYRAKSLQPRQNKHQIQKPIAKDTKKSKKSNMGQYSQFVGKSLFKIIPEGQDEGQKDKFAALNG